MAAGNDKQPFDWGILVSIFACMGLGAGLILYIRNNALLANGAQNLWNAEAIVMLCVLGVPFVLTALHLVRTLAPPRNAPQ